MSRYKIIPLIGDDLRLVKRMCGEADKASGKAKDWRCEKSIVRCRIQMPDKINRKMGNPCQNGSEIRLTGRVDGAINEMYRGMPGWILQKMRAEVIRCRKK